MWIKFLYTSMKSFLADGLAIFVLNKCIVRIVLLANRLTYWPVSYSIYQIEPIDQQINLLAKNCDLLANKLTCGLIPYNWQVNYNSSYMQAEHKNIWLKSIFYTQNTKNYNRFIR